MSKREIIEQLDQAIDGMFANPGVLAPTGDAELMELLEIAGGLRQLPGADFRANLKADLERRAAMSTKPLFRPGFHTVTPYLHLPGEENLDFIKHVFGAVETFRTGTPNGGFHVEFTIGDAKLMAGVNVTRTMPMALHVYVPDADEAYRRAIENGASSLQGMSEDYGERFGSVRDGGGNYWYIATRTSGPYVPESLHAVTTYFHPAGSAKFIDFLKQAFAATEIERYDSPEGAVLHAKIRIGDGAVEVGEAHGPWQSMPCMMYLYVPDTDAMYAKAIQAGGKSIQPPADQAYGDRTAAIEDPFGNQWYMGTPIQR